jgi:arylsulfatase A-like enzyme
MTKKTLRLPNRSRSALAVLTLLLVVLAGCARSSRPPRRIVLVTLDTLRLDSFFGNDERESTMPLTLAHARMGHVFPHFYSATSTTQPTHATLFTGLHPWETGVPRNGCILSLDHETLAEKLRSDGWSTAAVVASFPLHGRFGFAQGFDVYDDAFTETVGASEWEGAEVSDGSFYSLADHVTDRALALLDEARGDRQFFWFHYFDPHSPYGDTDRERVVDLPELLEAARVQAPDLAARIDEARSLYDRDVAHLDRALDRLLLRLLVDEAAGIESTLIFTADHGESFGEDGSLGHGKRLTPEQVHVPLFLISASLSPTLRLEVAGTIDLNTTILSLAGISHRPTHGRDLTLGLEPGKGEAFGMRRTFLTPFPDQRTSGHVVTVSGSRFFAVKKGELYAGNTERIRTQDKTGAAAPPEVAGELRLLFMDFEKILEKTQVIQTGDAEVEKRLEQLGYVQ